MIRKSIIALLLAATGVSAHANTITQWNFNSTTPDGSTGTGVTIPNIGTGTASLTGGATSPSFNSGAGSSDSAASDNSGWQTTTYTAQGTGDKTRGVEFKVSTLGFKDVVISYDLRHSNTSSRYEQVQYSLNGTTFNDIALFDGNAGDTWFNARSVDLSAIAGVSNNANFAFRVVSTFAPGSTAYTASDVTKSYAATGTWRFDMATVSGTAVTAVPEPKNYAMFLAGLGLMGLIARRQSSR